MSVSKWLGNQDLKAVLRKKDFLIPWYIDDSLHSVALWSNDTTS